MPVVPVVGVPARGKDDRAARARIRGECSRVAVESQEEESAGSPQVPRPAETRGGRSGASAPTAADAPPSRRAGGQGQCGRVADRARVEDRLRQDIPPAVRAGVRVVGRGEDNPSGFMGEPVAADQEHLVPSAQLSRVRHAVLAQPDPAPLARPPVGLACGVLEDVGECLLPRIGLHRIGGYPCTWRSGRMSTQKFWKDEEEGEAGRPAQPRGRRPARAPS